jgi:putative DNA primase/helicase
VSVREEVLKAGLAWYQAGACVLPVAADGSKRPNVSSWTDYQTERPNAIETAMMIDRA